MPKPFFDFQCLVEFGPLVEFVVKHVLASVLQYTVACEEEYDEIVLTLSFTSSFLESFLDFHDCLPSFLFSRVIRQIVDLIWFLDTILLEAFAQVVAVFLCLQNVA